MIGVRKLECWAIEYDKNLIIYSFSLFVRFTSVSKSGQTCGAAHTTLACNAPRSKRKRKQLLNDPRIQLLMTVLADDGFRDQTEPCS